MTHPTPKYGLVLALACAAACSMIGCTAAPTVDASLEPGAQFRPLATLSASGVQIYECRAEPGKPAPAWAFVAPQALLQDTQGRSVGAHGAGPFWEANDGSRILGGVKARVEAPRAGDIPWLLLTAHSTGNAGVFSGVTHVQRLHTQGGVAPAEACSAEVLGQRRLVPYRADYRLFTAA